MAGPSSVSARLGGACALSSYAGDNVETNLSCRESHNSLHSSEAGFRDMGFLVEAG